MVQANPDALRILFDNVIGNAVKFSEEGDAISIRARTDEDYVTVEVEDEGIGMNPDEVPDLFEAFQQGSTGFARTYEGAGLGLTVVNQLLNQIGGTIEIDTEPGEGTRVAIRLPKAKTTDPA